MSNENEGAIQPQEILSSDVVALCTFFCTYYINIKIYFCVSSSPYALVW